MESSIKTTEGTLQNITEHPAESSVETCCGVQQHSDEACCLSKIIVGATTEEHTTERMYEDLVLYTCKGSTTNIHFPSFNSHLSISKADS